MSFGMKLGMTLGQNRNRITVGPIRVDRPSLSPGFGQSGTGETITPGTYTPRGGGTVVVTHQHIVGGVVVSTGLTYTPQGADIGLSYVVREIATETGGTEPGELNTGFFSTVISELPVAPLVFIETLASEERNGVLVPVSVTYSYTGAQRNLNAYVATLNSATAPSVADILAETGNVVSTDIYELTGPTVTAPADLSVKFLDSDRRALLLRETEGGLASVVYLNSLQAAAAQVAPQISAAPTVAGTYTEGEVITFTAGTVSGEPAPTETFTLYRDNAVLLADVTLTGARSYTHTLTAADVGLTLGFGHLASNGVNPDAELFSAATPVIAAASAPNTAPVAVDDTGLTTPFETVLDIDVLANDTDADNDTLSLSGTPTASSGTVAYVGGLLRYTPATGFDGAVTLTYEVTDGEDTDTASVSITVAEEIVAPTPPEITAFAFGSIDGTALSLDLTVSEACEVDWVMTSSTTAPTPAQVAAGTDNSDVAATASGTVSVAASGVITSSGAIPTDLDATYDFYANAHDGSGNRSTDVDSVTGVAVDTTTPAPPTSAFSDDFNRADEQLDADAGWSGGGSNFNIVSNELVISTQFGGAALVAGTYTNDQRFDLEIRTGAYTAGDLEAGPCVRTDGTANSGYQLIYNRRDETVVLQQGTTALATSTFASLGIGTGDTVTLGIEAVGTAIQGYIDGVSIGALSATNALYTSGSFGINSYLSGSNTVILDNCVGEEI